MREQKRGWCALCRSRCGATFFLEDGKLAGAGPDPLHPTGKSLCLKGKAAAEILYDPDRLLYPLKRTNPKTSPDPGWTRITWDEALATIGEKLREIRTSHGPEFVAYSTTTTAATAISDSIDWVERLIRGSGSPNYISTIEVCNWHRDATIAMTYGVPQPYPDWPNTDLIVLWGFNPSSVWLDQATQVAQGRANGAKVLVIDPRRAGAAIGADHWLRVRPGSDGVLAMGMIRYLMEQGRFITSFLRRWSNAALLVREDGEFLRGRDLSDHHHPDAFVTVDTDGALHSFQRNDFRGAEVLEGADLLAAVSVETRAGTIACKTAYAHLREAAFSRSLDEVASETWVPREAFETAALAIADAGKVAYATWTGLGQHASSTQINRALAVLMSFKDSFDAQGGNIELARQPSANVAATDRLTEAFCARALGQGERPLGPSTEGKILAHDFYTSVLDGEPYRVRALVNFGANLILAHSDPLRGRAAFQALDFYVHCDVLETPTAQFADILLPINTAYERDAVRIGFQSGLAAEEHIQYRPALVAPLGEAKSDMQVAFLIAAELGLDEMFFHGNLDDALAFQLAPTGIRLDDLKKSEGGVTRRLRQRFNKYAERTDEGRYQGFLTETGLIELYSAKLARVEQPAVPRFSTEVLPGNSDFPFALTTAKTGYFCHTHHRNISSLRRREPDPTVQLAPESAERIGLAEGDWAEIQTAQASVRMRVVLNRDLDPRVAKAAYGWWQGHSGMGLPGYDPFSPNGANYNLLIEGRENLDPVSGTAALRSTSCRVNPIAAKARRGGWTGFRPMKVVERTMIADKVVKLTLAALDGDMLPDFEAGQHLVVKVGGETQPIIARCYSLVCRSRDVGRSGYSIAVRLAEAQGNATSTAPGRMSSFVHEKLKLGDVIEVKAPSGRFMVRSSASNVVLVAGGIGITPMLSYLETVAFDGAAPKILLVYVNRDPRSEAFIDRLADLAAQIPTLTIERYLTRNLHAPLEAKLARPDFNVLAAELPLESTHVYLCGPAALTDAARAAFLAAGHRETSIFEEVFTEASTEVEALPAGPFSIEFSRSRLKVEWRRESGSILDLAEASGVSTASGCRVGQCESCEVRILSGEARHSGDVSHPGGDRVLACRAYPKTDLILDV